MIRPKNFTGVQDTDERGSRYEQDDMMRPFHGEPVSLESPGSSSRRSAAISARVARLDDVAAQV